LGFVRRYNFFPTQQVIGQIEGVIIADMPQPGGILGVGTGVACCIGEFADCSNSLLPDGAGGFTQKIVPTQVFSAADAVNEVGGFDPTIGDFGISGGNGYVDALKNKQFSALVLCAVNIASAKAGRLVRVLPTNTSATNPAPAVAMQAGAVPAGTEFTTSGGVRVRTAGMVNFTDTPAYASGVDGALASATTAVSQTFTSASLNALLLAKKINVGDIIVLGVIGDATYGVATILNSYYGCYRVLTAPASGTTITIQQLDGTTFAIPTQTTIPWRLHCASTYDSAAGGQASTPGAAFSTLAAYTVPARPLDTGGIAVSSVVAPTTPAAAPTATGWAALSGLTFLTNATNAITYTAAIQAPNAAYSAAWDPFYQACFDALLSDDLPARSVNIVWCARTSSYNRSAGAAHVATASSRGRGRMFVAAPDLAQQSVAAVTASADPGVAANRSERVVYSWPGAQMLVSEASNIAVQTATSGKLTSDGLLDVRMDGFVASVLSVLAPERNPGQTAPPVGGTGGVLSVLSGFQRGVSGLTIDSYSYLRSQGVAALHFDQILGPEILSGITTSLVSGQTNINRRRFADFIEDSLAQALQPFVKLPVTNALIDAATGEIDNFLNDMKSSNNPAAQRISDYSVDAKSGNTRSQLALGIFVIKVAVQMLATADFIVLQADVGPGVTIKQV
jgi:hypothetical protein